MRHSSATSERPKSGNNGRFFVIALCHAMDYHHESVALDEGPVTCLSCIIETT